MVPRQPNSRSAAALTTHRCKKGDYYAEQTRRPGHRGQQGIGLQIAKDLAAHGFTVLIGSRNLGRGETAATNPHRSMFGTYSSSKTALNAITLAFASDLESTGIKVNAACPGFTATDLNNFQGTRTVEQAAREPVRLALLDANGPTGTFSNEDGPIPW